MSVHSDSIVFDPSLVSTLTVGSIKAAREFPDCLATGIPQMDDHYVMMRPRRVNGILAYTSHGKTSVMNIMARNFIPQIQEDEIVVYCTWEDSVEDMTLSYLANVSRIPLQSLFSGKLSINEWDAMMKAATQRASTPLWLIGHSEGKEARRPRLTMTDIWVACEYITDNRKKKIRAIFLDYLQRINRDDMKGDTRGQYMGIMDKVKDLALGFNTNVVIGSQVGRDVKDRKWQQPQDNDAQETSNFEQTCDGIISLWIPKKTEKMDECLIEKKGIDGQAVFVTENLMLINTLKQKKAKAPVLRAVDFLPETGEIKTYTYTGVKNER
jgi:replicative DNA helicase